MKEMKKVELYANHHMDADTIFSLRGTKVCELRYIDDSPNTWDMYYKTRNTDHESNIKFNTTVDESVTAWSNVMRKGLEFLTPHIRTCMELCGDKVFIESYEGLLNIQLDEQEVKPNVNFVKRLFKEEEVDTLIKSTVYRNNKNHCIKILTDSEGNDWYACSVFTGEIVWVLSGLIDTIDYVYNKYLPYDKYKSHPTPFIQINFYKRESEDNKYLIDEIKDDAVLDLENLTNITSKNNDLANDLITLFINASILQTKADDSVTADLELMKSKYIEIASKHNIDLIEMLQKMVSM